MDLFFLTWTLCDSQFFFILSYFFDFFEYGALFYLLVIY